MRRSISIIIPAFNEEKRLPATLATIRSYLDSGNWEFFEIVVVDDGSRDGTVEQALQCGARVLRNGENRGKGYTVRHGMLVAQGDWILFTDADLSAPIQELEKLWTAAEGNRAQVTVGSRALDRSLIEVRQPLFREAMGRCFNLVTRSLTRLPFSDTQCGFKLFEGKAARAIFSRQRLDGFGFDVEVLFLAQKLGFRAVEVPVCWSDAAGTKVSLFGGISAFLDPLRVIVNSITGKYSRPSSVLRDLNTHLDDSL
jgi:glycosyltransferase involved in cell wall biosynthesis